MKQCSFVMGVGLILWVVAFLTLLKKSRIWNVTLVGHFVSMIPAWIPFYSIWQIWERSAEAARPEVYKYCDPGVCSISMTFPPVHPTFDVIEHQPASWWHEWPRQIHRFSVQYGDFSCRVTRSYSSFAAHFYLLQLGFNFQVTFAFEWLAF